MPHQTMDSQARAAYESQSLQLRAELKKWENDWASASGGRKPGRDDIKQNVDIAQKYKQYNKLRDILAGKIPPPAATDGQQQQRKRTQSEAALIPPQTPSKRPKSAQTPRKAYHPQADPMLSEARTPSAAAAVNTPSLNRTLFTPVAAVPTSISPTPQKDGRVLGIFDLLSSTPSRSTDFLSISAPPNPLTASTPSKRRQTEAPTTTTTTLTTPTTARFARTPQSKRHSTTGPPLHERPDNGNTATITTPFKTPSSNRVSKLGFTPKSVSTPSFLRRRTTSITAGGSTTAAGLSRVDEQDEGGDDVEGGAAWKVGPLRLPRKLVLGGRGLSSVVAGLRKMEDEEFREEEEAMREMEMEMDAGRPTVVKEKKGGVVAGGVEVGHSQAPAHPEMGDAGQEDNSVALLSGFDNEALYDSLDEEKQLHRGQPLRVFKKRGQKRTTRLVNMRPTRSKRPSGAAQAEEEDDDDDVVPETQVDASRPKPDDGDDLLLSDPNADFDDSGSDSGSDDDEGSKKTKAKTQKKKAPAKEKEEGVVKRAVRKVKATAHANFKRLKLKNTGSKGGPGHNSRFRRRR